MSLTLHLSFGLKQLGSPVEAELPCIMSFVVVLFAPPFDTIAFALVHHMYLSDACA